MLTLKVQNFSRGPVYFDEIKLTKNLTELLCLKNKIIKEKIF